LVESEHPVSDSAHTDSTRGEADGQRQCLPTVVVTGAAGFIGFHVAKRLLIEGHHVLGVDCFTPYYDVALKRARFAQLVQYSNFQPAQIDLSDAATTAALFADFAPGYVIHLAAQPGVRQALTNPHPYLWSNIVAFLNVLEGCRHAGVKHLIYASSSSVYGANRAIPFSERQAVDHPLSLYAATKKSNELMAHAYSHLFRLPATGLRFFTVYGPWGRPDMAVYTFVHAIAEGRPIQLANSGKVRRDFTYIDDVVEGILRVARRPATRDAAWDPAHPDPATSDAPHRVYNIGNGRPEELNRLVALIEATLGRKANPIDCPLPPGDVLETEADVSDLRAEFGFAPMISLEEGVGRFIAWYRQYHSLYPADAAHVAIGRGDAPLSAIATAFASA
jgi:UDP-glucuronate 4-epimerase